MKRINHADREIFVVRARGSRGHNTEIRKLRQNYFMQRVINIWNKLLGKANEANRSNEFQKHLNLVSRGGENCRLWRKKKNQ